jgi:hypothetical protein
MHCLDGMVDMSPAMAAPTRADDLSDQAPRVRFFEDVFAEWTPSQTCAL